MARLEGLEPPTYRFEVVYYSKMNDLDALLRRHTIGYAVANYAGPNRLLATAYRCIPQRTGHRGWSPAFRLGHICSYVVRAMPRREQVL